MARLLFIVEDSFAIKGRGLVLVPGVALEDQAGKGTRIVLKVPLGTKLKSTILGAESFMDSRVSKKAILVNLNKSQVPNGTEIWTDD